jgi:aminopeptidase N
MPRGVYNLYDATAENLTITISAHETAHQWWFEQVGSDQALQPWLDEALAAYSEHVFYESVYPKSVSWWWTEWLPRVGGNQSLPWVDTDIYSAGGFIQYTNTIYLHGAHFLDDLRGRIGDSAFFAFLQDYRTQENAKIATANDFFRILRLHTTTDFSDIVRQYFQNTY